LNEVECAFGLPKQGNGNGLVTRHQIQRKLFVTNYNNYSVPSSRRPLLGLGRFRRVKDTQFDKTVLKSNRSSLNGVVALSFVVNITAQKHSPLVVVSYVCTYDQHADDQHYLKSFARDILVIGFLN
jgi:hypothetical protein